MSESDQADLNASRKNRQAKASSQPSYHYDSHMPDLDDPPVAGTTRFTREVQRLIGKRDPDDDPDYD